jgi:threonine dehydrogenase-like Zn-dependent dehydrogenase
MKTAKFIGNGRVKIVDKPVPQVGEEEVLVKVAYCGVCGSEKRIVRSGFDKCTPGHEISGTVEACGKKPALYAKGTSVMIYLSNYCGRCAACQTLNTSQCTDRQGLIGWSFDGGYAEYVVVPKHMVIPIGDLPLIMGVLALDTIGTAFHGLRQANIHPQHSVLVLGNGPIGLGCVSILKNYYGISSLYAADTSAYHCDVAERLGAQPIYVDPADTAGSVAAALGRQVDRVIEVVGIDATVSASLKCVCPGGKIVLIGEPEKTLTIIRSTDWVLKDFSLINSWYFPISEIGPNLTYIREHQTEVEKLATHFFPMEKMTEAYEIFSRGETGKVLIKM